MISIDTTTLLARILIELKANRSVRPGSALHREIDEHFKTQARALQADHWQKMLAAARAIA